MSIREEQYRSLKYSKELLREMMLPNFKKQSSKEIKDKAYRCLRHFPYLEEDGKPYFSKD